MMPAGQLDQRCPGVGDGDEMFAGLLLAQFLKNSIGLCFA